MSLLSTLSLMIALASPTAAGPSADPIERLSGFATVVINHINRTIGTENLPAANGAVVQPGMFVTISPQALIIFDREAVKLQQGRVPTSEPAPQCSGACPQAFYDAFQHEWLSVAVEGAALANELPSRVHFAIDSRLPVSTLLQAAYAAAASRPIQPPELGLLVNSARGGLRSRPFFLVPPGGLELPQGSAALGLTVRIRQGGLVVEASDPSLATSRRLETPAALQSFLARVKKSHPGKEAIVIVPEIDLSVSELMQVIDAVRDEFPRIVLSQGQDIII